MVISKASRESHETKVCARNKGRWNQLTWIQKNRTLRRPSNLRLVPNFAESSKAETARYYSRSYTTGAETTVLLSAAEQQEANKRQERATAWAPYFVELCVLFD
jgi:hypothetical protein